MRGFTILLDEDIQNDWSSAVAAAPDFLFISLGGSLSESVNPPPGLFSAAAILAPGHRAPDEFDLLRSLVQGAASGGEEGADPRPREIAAHAVSRVVQAAGRVQRSPESRQPVLLLNRVFAEPDYLNAWPCPWFDKSPHELCVFLSDRSPFAKQDPQPCAVNASPSSSLRPPLPLSMR